METVSSRLDIKTVDLFGRVLKEKRSEVVRELVESGKKHKAVELYKMKKVSLGLGANLAGVSLSEFIVNNKLFNKKDGFRLAALYESQDKKQKTIYLLNIKWPGSSSTTSVASSASSNSITAAATNAITGNAISLQPCKWEIGTPPKLFEVASIDQSKAPFVYAIKNNANIFGIGKKLITCTTRGAPIYTIQAMIKDVSGVWNKGTLIQSAQNVKVDGNTYIYKEPAVDVVGGTGGMSCIPIQVGFKTLDDKIYGYYFRVYETQAAEDKNIYYTYVDMSTTSTC